MKSIEEVLNEAFGQDPGAIHALLTNHVPCNESLANNQFIPVQVNAVCNNVYNITALGLINGILESQNLPKIAIMWEQSDDNYKMKGFCKYEDNLRNRT